MLRKFYDSVYINVYTTLYLEDNYSFENLVVKQIQDWLRGKDTLPSTQTISNYIRNHKKLKDLNTILFKDKTYRDLRDRGNDNAHYNFYQNVILNDDKIYNKERGTILEQISSDISHVVIMHASYMFYINQHYMASSDYIDYLEMGHTPPEDSQYWVAPFIQDIFDSLIREQRPDIAELIMNTTSMHLE